MTEPLTDPAPSTAEKAPARKLAGYLAALVSSRAVGDLADLRRPHVPSQARLTAQSFAPAEADRAVYGYVAFLFARYHAGALQPSWGAGSLGAALRRIGSDGRRGPSNPGACRLLDRVAASRQIPWRHLQHAIERSRAGDTLPPSWAELADDLVRWPERGRPIAEKWARDFYTPRRTTPKGM